MKYGTRKPRLNFGRAVLLGRLMIVVVPSCTNYNHLESGIKPPTPEPPRVPPSVPAGGRWPWTELTCRTRSAPERDSWNPRTLMLSRDPVATWSRPPNLRGRVPHRDLSHRTADRARRGGSSPAENLDFRRQIDAYRLQFLFKSPAPLSNVGISEYLNDVCSRYFLSLPHYYHIHSISSFPSVERHN
jgi:hypothetical protein